MEEIFQDHENPRNSFIEHFHIVENSTLKQFFGAMFISNPLIDQKCFISEFSRNVTEISNFRWA